MSAYGKLWQQVADIRAELGRMFPGACTNSLKEARVSCKSVPNELHGYWADLNVLTRPTAREDRARYLLDRWADLEREMARTDD